MPDSLLRPRLRAISAVLMVLALAACAGPAAPPTPTAPPPSVPPVPTATEVPTATLSPTASPEPTGTPIPSETPTPTVTPTPTLAPDAITAATADQLDIALALDDHYAAVWGVAVSPDGALVASGSADRSVRVFDAATGALLHEFDRHRSIVYALAWSPDGTRLASGSRDRTVQVWDPVSGERFYGSQTPGEAAHVAFSPDGTRLAASGYYSAIGEVWEAATGAPLYLIEGHSTRLRAVAWSPDGRWLASSDGAGVVVLHDAATGEVVRSFTAVEGAGEALAFGPGARVLAVGSDRGMLTLWSLEGDKPERLGYWSGHSGLVTGLHFTRDGSVLISSGRDGGLRLWDAPGLVGYQGGTGLPHRLGSYARHGASVRGIALSADGRTLVSGGDDARLLVWRVGGG